ncbi:DUF2218 domain-containing protein [Sphingobium aquiterrae]|uniref:DUF2218 domain-containing protein n=1 Tax=Sphingobium aquiterrae TaxID=2038656 RepID=UPI003017098B
MASATAQVPTKSGSRYLQQLCKHWSHKFETDFDAERGTIALPIGTATMVAAPDSLNVTVTTDEADGLDRLKEVVASHLDRFAFREAPLTFDWR